MKKLFAVLMIACLVGSAVASDVMAGRGGNGGGNAGGNGGGGNGGSGNGNSGGNGAGASDHAADNGLGHGNRRVERFAAVVFGIGPGKDAGLGVYGGGLEVQAGTTGSSVSNNNFGMAHKAARGSVGHHIGGLGSSDGDPTNGFAHANPPGRWGEMIQELFGREYGIGSKSH